MKSIHVKKLTIGEGMPKIAVPVMAGSPEETIRKVSDAAAAADLIELRADSCPEITEPERLQALLRGVSDAAGGKPVLFTVRTEPEGGLFRGSRKAYGEILRNALLSGFTDLVDIEAFPSDGSPEMAEELVRIAHEQGAAVVLSSHDFAKTPDSGILLQRLRRMEQMGADIAKIACMPQSLSDADRMLAVSAAAKQELQIPFLAISMGEAGRKTRLSGEVYGSAVTFGCLPGEESAPGQVRADVLREELISLHGKLAGRKILFLIGFMGTGKTTIAREAARQLSLPLCEMDEEIERGAGRSISAIFSEDGEEAFRDLETGLLADLYPSGSCVVSCGGGCPLRPGNRALMHALGKVVCLTAEPETLLKRLAKEADKRPNIRERFSAEGIRELMEKRRPAYEAAADIILTTDGRAPREIAEEIISR